MNDMSAPDSSIKLDHGRDPSPCNVGRATVASGEPATALRSGDVLELLNTLLENIRAEARMTDEIEQLDVHRGYRPLFRHLHTEQMRSIILLMRRIEQLGGQPSLKTSELGRCVAADVPLERQIQVFNSCQRDLDKRIDAALPCVGDKRLQAELADLRARRAQCIERCTALCRR